ncbi:MAG: DUF5615 family PIN-like protein [Phycisphaeraceae bacterium]|nr:DUF5615 family PIN-like protein [Phycisphaeraceae bacterium]
MKLLFDENLSRGLVALLRDAYPESAHVVDCLPPSSADPVIWEHAKAHGFAIVTKDDDFNALSLVHGAPPKIIWIRPGNVSTEAVAESLRRARRLMEEFVADPRQAIQTLAVR